MDVLYAVKQLVHELNVLEAQVREKKTALGKLWPALSHQEQLLIDSPSMLPEGPVPSEGKPAAPDNSKPLPGKPKPKKSG
jgi:hypothetical protein